MKALRLENLTFGEMQGSLSLVQNFYIEFFGTLIPGMIAVASVIALSLGFCFSFAQDPSAIGAVSSFLSSFGGVAVFLTFSYVIGAVAYRRSPKKPDTIASHHQWWLTKLGSAKDEVDRLAVSFNPDKSMPKGIWGWLKFWTNREQWILHSTGSAIDFPYPHIRKYLCCRGLHKLATYIPWCYGDGSDAFKSDFQKGICSKTHINIMKQRLRNAKHPDLVLDMVRTECHIRMLCSLWYILTFVIRISLLAICIALFLAISETHRPSWFVFLAFVGALLAFYCRYSIENGLHYVRTREIVMLLESAWILDHVDDSGTRMRPDYNTLFHDMALQGENYRRSHCQFGICRFWNICYGKGSIQ